MIIDSISNAQKYTSLHKAFESAFSFIKELKKDAVAGITVLEKDHVWANVIDVKEIPQGNRLFEAHRKFLDIHYILSGEETFGYANSEQLEIEQPYDEADDYELLSGETKVVSLKEGDFVITYPEDAHIPDFEKTNDDKLIRVVVKVKI